MRKMLVGAIVAIGLLAQTSPAGASLKSLKRDCRAGDADACEEYAYKRCVAEVKKEGLDPDECDDFKP